MREFLGNRLPGMTGLVGGVFGSCCVLPIVLLVLGVGGTGFLSVTLRYRNILLPVGIGLLLSAYVLHFYQRRRCARQGCKPPAAGFNIAMLVVATVLILGYFGFMFALKPYYG